MQIKEFEASNLKECLQQVRTDLGPEAIILETRKFRKGGLLGWGARDGICIVAATGITVDEAPISRRGQSMRAADEPAPTRAASAYSEVTESEPPRATKMVAANGNGNQKTSKAASAPPQTAAVAAARAAFSRNGSANGTSTARTKETAAESRLGTAEPEERHIGREREAAISSPATPANPSTPPHVLLSSSDAERLGNLERYMSEIRTSLTALQREQREGQERTVTAVVSAVAPALSAANSLSAIVEGESHAPSRFPWLYKRLVDMGVAEPLAEDLLDSLPDFSAWSEDAQAPLAESALRDLIARRVASSGPIVLTPGQLKAVALIGPTGVGKTTTIAKLAARYALLEGKRVALLTVDTYRIAAVEQLKTYSQIIDIPIAVAYSQAEVLPAVEQFADYDLILIDTAGRSQKNLMQVGELKTLLEAVRCETHLVLSAQIKEQDMLEAARRFSVARVDRLIFSKLDETSSYGTLLNVADRTGIPLSYLTTGQKVPEDLEIADGGKLATLLLNPDMAREAVR